MTTQPDTLKIEGCAHEIRVIKSTLARMGPAIETLVRIHGVRFRCLDPRERFADVARSYRSCDTIDMGVCQGLFDPDERVIVLRAVEDWIVAHETSHLVDFALGDGTELRSRLDDDLKATFRRHRKDGFLISAYAGSNVAEFVAEAMRSRFGFGPNASGRMHDKERLAKIDPPLAALMDSWIAECAARTLDVTQMTPHPVAHLVAS